jgi:hypothetical protein
VRFLDPGSRQTAVRRAGELFREARQDGEHVAGIRLAYEAAEIASLRVPPAGRVDRQPKNPRRLWGHVGHSWKLSIKRGEYPYEARHVAGRSLPPCRSGGKPCCPAAAVAFLGALPKTVFGEAGLQRPFIHSALELR